VTLEIEGSVPELPAPRTLRNRLRGKPRLTLLEIRALVAELTVDTRPRGLLVTLRSFEGGMASALSLRELLARVRTAGRPVIVHVPHGLDTKAYFIASAASEIYAFPGASVALLGFASRGVYVREALVKAGVVAEVLAHGKYKSAGESLSRDSMSEPQREQVGALLDRMYVSLIDALGDGRKLSADEAKAAVDQAVYRAPEAVTARLLDASLFDDEITKKLTTDGDSEPRVVAAAAYVSARRATQLGKGRRGPCVGVVCVHGAISQGGSFLASGAIEREVIAAVRAAREDRKVRGVILHIDSPGGSALASARMHRELELLAAEKPLVAAMANVAASGGYYVAAPAHSIVAQPVTVTGSIGVIAARFAFGPLFERLGVHTEVVLRGARADLFNPSRPLHPDERAALEHEIDGTYREFVDVVARGRHKTYDEIHALAQGRVWTGENAHARGLVDQLGGFDVALDEVRRRIGKGGATLAPRVVRGQGKDAPTLSAKPADTANAASIAGSLVDELLGEWADLAPLAIGSERVLVWSPEAMGFRRG
jgi:protease-4